MDKFYPPYPQSPRRRSGGGKTNLASCAVAAAFLLIVLLVLAVVFFLLFRPRDPTIQITAIQLPGFSARNGTVAFTFAQSAAVCNPNRASFSHYDSTIRLIYRGSQVGFMYIPAGQIGGGHTQYMDASFAISQFPLQQQQMMMQGEREMEVESKMKLKGRVEVLKFFIHRVEATASCRVAVAPSNGAVMGVRC